MLAYAVSGISPAATSLRSWTAAGLKVLHEAFFGDAEHRIGKQIFFNQIQNRQHMKIQEIAAKAGVSIATVSRVFSHHPNIRNEVREKVFAVARKYGYQPRLSGKQKNIVVIAPYKLVYPVQAYVEMVLTELIRELSRHNFRIEILPHDNLERLDGIRFCGAVSIGFDAPEF